MCSLTLTANTVTGDSCVMKSMSLTGDIHSKVTLIREHHSGASRIYNGGLASCNTTMHVQCTHTIVPQLAKSHWTLAHTFYMLAAVPVW